ncbi:IS21 family transposase [Enterococcus sp. DIV0421]|uniref:IS21 family transposase n=1 Tax=Enterococcus sp. DIV0421 TaxID=2774688 RepID=UPI003F688E7C
MDDIKTIKHLRNNRDQSIDQIRKAMNINWRTAKKYADSDQLFITDPTRKNKSMMDDGWGEIIGSWLEEDLRLRRKLRRTAKAIYEQLKPLGFPGSYRTVCVYISQWKKQRYDETNYKAVDRLDHPIGEAQVDFGTMEVMHEDHMKDIQLLIMSFPYSNATFASAMPAQNQECFLEALKQLFDQCGGVPKKIRIDNLTPAVKKTKSKFEEAQLTDEFLRFTIHYGCDVQVCNPRSGHEKGHVENKVGYVRYNFFSTSPIMNSFESLNKQLEEQLKTDRKRTHYSKHQLIEDLWKKENKALHSLPQEDYPIFKEVEAKLNRYHEMKLDQTVIHIPKAYGYSQLTVVLTWNKFKVLTPHGDLLMNEYRPYMNKKRLIPWSDILKQWSNKLNVVSYSRYWKYLPARLQNYLAIDNNHLKYRRIKQLLSLLATYDIQQINEQFYELVVQEDAPSDFDVNWSNYDALTKSGGVQK